MTYKLIISSPPSSSSSSWSPSRRNTWEEKREIHDIKVDDTDTRDTKLKRRRTDPQESEDFSFSDKRIFVMMIWYDDIFLPVNLFLSFVAISLFVIAPDAVENAVDVKKSEREREWCSSRSSSCLLLLWSPEPGVGCKVIQMILFSSLSFLLFPFLSFSFSFFPSFSFGHKKWSKHLVLTSPPFSS